jgi:hypothetical protein
MKRASAVFIGTNRELVSSPKRYASRALVYNTTTGQLLRGPGTYSQLKPAFDASFVDLDVDVATTANITIASALVTGQTLDGITLSAGMKVLVKNQTTAHQNGIYTVAATPVRHVSYNTFEELGGILVNVEQGTQGGHLFLNTNGVTGTIGTTAITFARKDVGLLDRSGNAQISDMDGTESVLGANLMMVEGADGKLRAVSLSTLKTFFNAP